MKSKSENAYIKSVYIKDIWSTLRLYLYFENIIIVMQRVNKGIV